MRIFGLSKEYTFKLVVRSEYDSFWENDPSDKDVLSLVEGVLSQEGIINLQEGDLKIIRFEDKEERF